MVKIINSDEVKIKILKALSKETKENSYYAIRNKTKISIKTFLNNALFLELIGLIEVRKMKNPNGNIYRMVKISSKGEKALENIEKYKKGKFLV